MQSTPMKMSVQSVPRIEGGRAHEIAETRVFVITSARIERKRAQRNKDALAFTLTLPSLISFPVMTEDHRSCLVCNAEITSVHLGMDVCRFAAPFSVL